MPNFPWRPRITLIEDGEPVSQATTNRPTQQLAGQTLHLKQLVSNLETNSGRLIFSGAALTSDVIVGDVVYFDSFENAYAPALAETTVNTADGEYVAGPRSYVVGVVIAKDGLVGDILQVGRIDLNSISGSLVQGMVEDPVNDPFVPSRYYLSSKIPGKITRHVVYPNVQIGYITTEECHIAPLQKDLFETHRHYSFPLLARPSASQNFDQTGWNNFGDDSASGRKWVDYYNNGTDTTIPEIMVCVRNNLSVVMDPESPIRVELYLDASDDLAIELITGPTQDNPDSGVYPGSITVVDWPAYGEWISIPGTNLDVAFVRRDATYTNELSVDALADLTVPSDEWNRWKILLPHDISGWTNVNSFDQSTPYNAFYRYLTESDQALSNVFPPAPTGSAFIEDNGTSLVAGSDFTVNIAGVFWIPANFTASYTYSPWAHDYSALSTWTPDNDLTKNLNLHFSRTGLGNANGVVRSLKGIAPITVKQCPTEDEADRGDLQVGIDLALLKSTADSISAEEAFIDVDGLSFIKGDIVCEIEAGIGIRIDRLTTSKNKNVGKLRISRAEHKFEGEVSSIALRNAKQEVGDYYSYIDFLPPSQTPTGIIAGFRIPSEGFNVNGSGFISDTVFLSLFSSFIGDTQLGASTSDQVALYSVSFHVLREDTVGASIGTVAEHQWSITYPTSYVPTTVLADSPAEADEFKIAASNFKPGDMVSVRIDRIESGDDSAIDTYPGRSGMVGLRWIIK